jgi:uncharacterized protein
MTLHMRVVLFSTLIGLTACAGVGDMNTAKKAAAKGDYQTAQTNYKNLADFGLPRANVELGKMYLYGRGVEKNPREALAYFQRARDAGESPKIVTPFIDRAEMALLSSQIRQGSAAEKRKALVSLEQKAKNGNANAAFHIAQAYEKGWGAAVSGRKALSYYIAAGQGGVAKGYYQAGMLHRRGKLVSKDEGRAAELIELAKKNGYTQETLASR